MRYYLGIDFGTSGARAIAITTATDSHCPPVVAEAACRFPSVSSQDLPALWQATLWDLIGQIPTTVRSQLSAIAINGTSATVLLCDAQGHPLHPPLMYSDTSAHEVVKTLATIAPFGHCVLSASSSLAKLLWLSQQVNGSAARYFLHQADWLAFLLHGQPGISDYHNSLKLGYDPAAEQYPDWFGHPKLQHLGPLLPKVLGPGTVVGVVTSAIAQSLKLSPHCRICAGTTDSIAAFLASGAQTPGEAVTSLGSTLVLKLLSQTRVDDADFGIYSHRLGDLWLVGGASNTGGAILAHFFTSDEIDQISQQINPQQASSLQYYPLLKPGERFPVNDPQLQPLLEPRPTDSVAFLHGLLESLARVEAQSYQLLQAKGATPVTRIYTAGGGAKNSTWTAIRQRYLRVPFAVSQHYQAAYGTACLGYMSESNSDP
jgi:sugar (pentulose or hexulose) kinase